MENREFARVLSETADLMEIAGEDGFRIRSYRNAASAIEGYPERVDDILAEPGAQGHRDSRHRQRPRERARGNRPSAAPSSGAIRCWQKFPPDALELLKIQGLGPKSIALVFEHHQVATIDELERICHEQKLRELPRMGAKLEEKVLKSIAQYRQRTGRFLLSFAQEVADELTAYLSETAGHREDHARRQPAARQGNHRRSRSSGHRPGAPPTRSSDSSRIPRRSRCWAKARTRPASKYGLRRPAGGSARAPARKLRRGPAVFHRQQGAQRACCAARAEDGLHAQRIRLFRLENEERVAGETEEEIYAALGLRLDSAGAARKLRRDRSAARRPAARS